MKSVGNFSSLVVALLTVSLVGCGGEGLVPVKGLVTLDGKPLAGATVTLQRSVGPIKERVFWGETDASGQYQIMTADRGSTGAPLGEYRVMITSVKLSPDINELTKIPPDRVPARWRDGSQTFTVPESGTTDANFAVTSR